MGETGVAKRLQSVLFKVRFPLSPLISIGAIAFNGQTIGRGGSFYETPTRLRRFHPVEQFHYPLRRWRR